MIELITVIVGLTTTIFAYVIGGSRARRKHEKELEKLGNQFSRAVADKNIASLNTMLADLHDRVRTRKASRKN